MIILKREKISTILKRETCDHHFLWIKDERYQSELENCLQFGE